MTREKKVILYLTRGMFVAAAVGYGFALPFLTAGGLVCGIVSGVALLAND